MKWKELKNSTPDRRDFYWWEREQEAILMRDAYLRLGHPKTAEGWENQRIKSRLERNLKP